MGYQSNKYVLNVTSILMALSLMFAGCNRTSLPAPPVELPSAEERSKNTLAYVLASGIGVPPDGISNQAQARLMAERAATVVAMRNLLEVIKDLPLTNGHLVCEEMISSRELTDGIENLVRDADYMPDPDTGEDFAYLPDTTVRAMVYVYVTDLDVVLGGYGLRLAE